MLVALREFVRNVLVIIVLATFLQLILPQGSMRRYAHLALALVMVLTLLGPLLALTRSSWDVSELLGQAQAQTAWTELQASSELLKQQNDASLLQTYRSMLLAQINDILTKVGEVELVDCKIVFVEDQQADDFGCILSIQMVCRETSSAVKPISQVETIQIGGAEGTGKQETPPTETVTMKGREVQQAIARYFLLEEDQVLVIIK